MIDAGALIFSTNGRKPTCSIQHLHRKALPGLLSPSDPPIPAGLGILPDPTVPRSLEMLGFASPPALQVLLLTDVARFARVAGLANEAQSSTAAGKTWLAWRSLAAAVAIPPGRPLPTLATKKSGSPCLAPSPRDAGVAGATSTTGQSGHASNSLRALATVSSRDSGKASGAGQTGVGRIGVGIVLWLLLVGMLMWLLSVGIVVLGRILKDGLLLQFVRNSWPSLTS